MSEESSDLKPEVWSSDIEKNAPPQPQQRCWGRRSRLPLIVGGLMAITAAVGVVAAWKWVEERQEESAAAASSQPPPKPPVVDNPHASPFEKNHPPIPPPFGARTKPNRNMDCPTICLAENFEAMVDDVYEKFASTLHYLQTLVIETWWIRIDEAPPAVRSASVAVAKSIAIAKLKDIALKLGSLADSVTRDDVAEFYSYYASRQLYGEYGAEMLLKSLAWNDRIVQRCVNEKKGHVGLKCPKFRDEIDNTTAVQYLLNHADNTFSSICSTGHPFPWWSEPDGSGYLFQANSKTGNLYPVSGSGINMSAPMDSLTDYFTYQQQNVVGFVDPMSREWRALVESNPVYAWFMAGVTLADKGTICNNGDLAGTNTGVSHVDAEAKRLATRATLRMCTESDIPNANNPGTGRYSKQHFARMWYDLLPREYSKSDSVVFKGKKFDEIEQVKDCCYSTLTKYKRQFN